MVGSEEGKRSKFLSSWGLHPLHGHGGSGTTCFGGHHEVKRGDTGIGLSTGFQLPFISLGPVSEAKVPAGRTLVSALAG
jgi:hypothetical protein